MPATPKKSRGSFQRAFLKGLSIILPAVITIAIFAWVWGILRVNVVELILRGVDSIKVYGHRSGELNKKELLHLEDRFFHAEGEDALRNGKPYDPVPAQDRTNENLRRTITLADLPANSSGLTPLAADRSVLQVILDRWQFRREYDPATGRVLTYNWFEYLLGSLVGLGLVVLLGFVTRNFLGRKLFALLEWFVTRTPVVKSIYPHAKQLVEFFFADAKDKPLSFDKVVIVEYPRRGLWSLAFVTGTGIQTLQAHTKKRMITIYVPSSPAPMTGYTMFIAADDVIPIAIGVEDAMKLIVSGGVLAPMTEVVKPASGAQFALTHELSEQVRARRTAIRKKSDIFESLKPQEEKNPSSEEVDDGDEKKSAEPRDP